MSEAVAIAPTPNSAIDALARRLRPEPDFKARWLAWEARGRLHDLKIRRRSFSLVPAAAVVAAIAYLLLIR